MNSLLNKTNRNIKDHVTVNNQIISDPARISQAFNEHFTSVCSTQNYNTLSMSSQPNHSIPSIRFSFREILPLDVYRAIYVLKTNSSAGPDGVEVKFLKPASHDLMYPLADLFNLSLNTCTIPSIWKTARVVPLFKGGDPTNLNNYRQISIICAVAKIFEENIYHQLYYYIDQFNTLSPFQSGFHSGFLTTTALLKFTRICTLSLI